MAVFQTPELSGFTLLNSALASLHKGNSKSHCGHGACSVHLLWDYIWLWSLYLRACLRNDLFSQINLKATYSIVLEWYCSWLFGPVADEKTDRSCNPFPLSGPFVRDNWTGLSWTCPRPSSTMYSHLVIPPVNLFKRGRRLIHRGSFVRGKASNLSVDLEPINRGCWLFNARGGKWR